MAVAIQKDLKKFLEAEPVQNRIKTLLKDKANTFITSLLALTNGDKSLAECKPSTIVNSALMSASLDLPINKNLGFAYIIAYNKKEKYIDEYGKEKDRWYKEAQFQMGYKGFIQLAQRSNKFKTLNVNEIYKGEIKKVDRVTGDIFLNDLKDEQKAKGEVVGYLAYFKLLNGFEKFLYMSTAEITQHAKKYSKSFQKGYGLWADNFNAMAKKTVMKLLISKYAPLNIELTNAVVTDQGSITEGGITYPDNTEDKQRKVIKTKISEEKFKKFLEKTPKFVDRHKDTYEFTEAQQKQVIKKLELLKNE